MRKMRHQDLREETEAAIKCEASSTSRYFCAREVYLSFLKFKSKEKVNHVPQTNKDIQGWENFRRITIHHADSRIKKTLVLLPCFRLNPKKLILYLCFCLFVCLFLFSFFVKKYPKSRPELNIPHPGVPNVTA